MTDGEVAEAYWAMYRGMLERDTALLDDLLADDLDGATAVLVGRDVVDATIWGSRSTWNLQLTTTYEHRDDAWIAVRTIATTF